MVSLMVLRVMFWVTVLLFVEYFQYRESYCWFPFSVVDSLIVLWLCLRLNAFVRFLHISSIFASADSFFTAFLEYRAEYSLR